MGGVDGGIPEDKLPQCWSDDVRMNALFAPFRLKTVNPESWEMKMKFWSDMLRQWCRAKGEPIVSSADAKVAFQRKGRTPACIDIVVEEMFRSGELVPMSKYQQYLHSGPEGWVRWGARLAFKPATIALTAVTMLLPARQAIDQDGLPKASIESTQRFVLEGVLKEQATALLQNYPPGVERLGSLDELMKNCSWTHGRDAFELLVGWLVANGSAVVKDGVVKLADPAKKASPITETDEALVRLGAAEARLEADAARLARDRAGAEADARAALKIGNKVAAKNHLRRKHKAAQRLDQCTAALDNVKQLLHNIRDIDSNKTIVDTYRTTSEAMKRGMKENNLDEDSVFNTMDDLREVLESYGEVEKALSGPVEEVDADLEEELKELLGGGGGGGGRKDQSPTVSLPSPPKTTPRKRSEREREFVFDGEERVIAELNELGVEDATPPRAAGERVRRKDKESEAVPEAKPSKSWYPPSSECLVDQWVNNNEPYEVRQDERLHPGQPLNIDFTKPPKLFANDFQVQDHKLNSGVWLYNKDDNSNVDSLAASTEYFSPESPGKAPGTFQMAPGIERKKSVTISREDSSLEELERRLKNLRGFNLK